MTRRALAVSPAIRARPHDGAIAAHDAARGLRVGGQTVSAGEARIVPLILPGRADAVDAIPVWVAAGVRPGPRVTVVGAPRGFEVGAARVAAGLRALIDPAALQGGVVVVPVFRPGGRFVARGGALPPAVAWRFPGDPGGDLRAREAFTVFSEVAVGSSVLLLLTAAAPGLTAAPVVCGDMDDPRVRRLASYAGVPVVFHLKAGAGSLAAAAAEMGVAVLELRGPGEHVADAAMLAALAAVMAGAGACGVADAAADAVAPTRTTVVTHATALRAPIGGLLEQVAPPGSVFEKGALLARIAPPLLGRAVDVSAPHDCVVLEATARAAVRARAPLFLVGRISRGTVLRAQKRRRLLTEGRAPAESAMPEGAPAANPLRVGWVERVSLPSLGVERLRAKIDTGARTSALHVTRMTGVGTTDGPHRRPILELTLPAGSRRGAPPATVRVLVRDYVQVKDTSGRTERRPVIETTLRLGTLERRIRVTLTNRGDMLFPLLIGRTALGPGVVVDPARRLLLPQSAAPRPRVPTVEPHAPGATGAGVATRPAASRPDRGAVRPDKI